MTSESAGQHNRNSAHPGFLTGVSTKSLHKRIAFYSQHTAGVGHHFRNREIVRELVKAHDIYFIDGGRPIPGADLPDGVNRIALTPVRTGAGGLTPADTRLDLQAVLQERQSRLAGEMANIRPDVFLIEFFPFSRWSLRAEIVGAIEAARRANPEVKVLCSLRDIPPRTPTANLQPMTALPMRLNGEVLRFYSVPFGGAHHEQVQRARRYYAEVCPTLNASFDAVLVHGDPELSRLEEHFPWVEEIAIPVVYTGFVSERLSEHAPPKQAPDRYVLVSAGGGTQGYALARPCIEAWKRLHAQGAVESWVMVVFAGAFIDDAHFESLRNLCDNGPFQVERFTSDFLRWMHGAHLSISRAGYNTCMNVLETRTRAILAPIVAAGDQEFRAQRLYELGLADVVQPGRISTDEMEKAIPRGLSRPEPVHNLKLDGAVQVRTFLDSPGMNKHDRTAKSC